MREPVLRLCAGVVVLGVLAGCTSSSTRPSVHPSEGPSASGPALPGVAGLMADWDATHSRIGHGWPLRYSPLTEGQPLLVKDTHTDGGDRVRSVQMNFDPGVSLEKMKQLYRAADLIPADAQFGNQMTKQGKCSVALFRSATLDRVLPGDVFYVETVLSTTHPLRVRSNTVFYSTPGKTARTTC